MTAARSFDGLLDDARDPVAGPELAVQLGLRAIDERREDDALPVVAAIAARTPGDSRLLHVTGLLHRSTGNLAAAIVALDQALAIAPSSPRLVHARARATLEAGLPAVDWYGRAARLAPTDGDIVLGQAAALLAARDGAAADSLLSDMLRQHPGWLPGHEALMRLRYAAGDIDRCTQALDSAIAGAPADTRLHMTKIMGLQRGGLAERAGSALAEAYTAAGDALPLRQAAAILATENDRLVAADAAFATLDPVATPDLAVYWFRHLLRRGEAGRLADVVAALPPALADVAEPYRSIARRLTSDARGDRRDADELVSVIDAGPGCPSLTALAETLRELHVAQCQPLDQSVRGGTQTDGPLFLRIDPVIQQLARYVRDAVAAYITALPCPAEHPFLAGRPQRPRTVGSWSVRLANGGFHEPHVHGSGWLSSAFYVALPEPCSDRQAGWLTIGEPQRSLGTGLSPLRLIEPKPGRLVLFPSTTWHGTRPFDSGERLTIAFDIA